MRPFPNVDDGRWLVSTEGGAEPAWAHSGGELFYRNGNGDLIAVEVLDGATFATGTERTLFAAGQYRADVFHRMYDVAPDDQRFVMIRVASEGDNETELIVVENFFEELKEIGRN